MIRKLSLCLILALFHSPAWAEGLEIYFIDVEQADATLVVSPSKNTLLIDSGKNGMGGRIKAVMDAAGVTQIDHFVATHYHEDHYGGIDDLVDMGVPVLNAYDRGDKQFVPARKRNQQTYKDYVAAVGDYATHLMRGETIPLDAQMTVTTISSGGVVLGEHDPVPAHHENDMSVSLLINYQGFQLFVGGDIETHTEEKIAARDIVRDIDIYQSNHHGSHSSSSVAFMEDLRPSLVVVSNGNTRKYQHPRQVTLDTYAALSPAPMVLQTNKFLHSGNKFGNVDDASIADLPPNGKNGTIKVVVDPASETMVVSYTNHSHTLPAKNMGAVPAGGLVIARLLPDPAGSDRQNEAVVLRNDTGESMDLSLHFLRDEGGRIWLLSGDIAPGESRQIIREAMPMSLDNNGDTISLILTDGTVVDAFTYTDTHRGIWIDTGH